MRFGDAMRLYPQDPLALQVAIERARSHSPHLQPYRAGMGFCEGCKSNQPRPAKAHKGWRCASCRKN